MKDVPEIAPEIRGLLEEIVANPRSAIRLAPRRALSSWFDSGEMVRATDVSRDRAARHLVEAHREELAALLREASWISYWKAPVLSYRPLGEDGGLYDPTRCEPDWRRRAERRATASMDATAIELLQQCIEGIKPQRGRALALASLGLVPNDKTRFNVAYHEQWSKPRSAIALFSRLLRLASSGESRSAILISLGSQACSLGLFGDAHRFYQEASRSDPQALYGWGCAFNLSCFLGDERMANEEAAEVGRLFSRKDPRLFELQTLLREWRRTRSESERSKARRVIGRIRDQIPESARALCEDLDP